MDVPKKLKLLGYLKKVFPIWALGLQAGVVERAFNPELAKTKTLEGRRKVMSRRDWETSEFDAEIEELWSLRLLKKARKLYIPLEGLKWQETPWGNRVLSYETQSALYRAIQNERRGRWEFWLKVLTSLTGLAGALIGLVAILKK